MAIVLSMTLIKVRILNKIEYSILELLHLPKFLKVLDSIENLKTVIENIILSY